MKIYTRTGDKGQTSLTDGKRVSKASDRVETYGTVDELNSIIGVARAHLKASERSLKVDLKEIQQDLFTIGAALANPKNPPVPRLKARTLIFEKRIDALTDKLPPLKNFILPGGGPAGAFLHQARTVCRRAERTLVSLVKDEPVDDTILQYFNRLSDLLFTFARYANLKEKKKETVWLNT